MNRQESRQTRDQSKYTAPLEDLPLIDEQAEETRAGQTDTTGYNTWRTNFGRTS